jgi:hypothetical protein
MFLSVICLLWSLGHPSMEAKRFKWEQRCHASFYNFPRFDSPRWLFYDVLINYFSSVFSFLLNKINIKKSSLHVWWSKMPSVAEHMLILTSWLTSHFGFICRAISRGFHPETCSRSRVRHCSPRMVHHDSSRYPVSSEELGASRASFPAGRAEEDAIKSGRGFKGECKSL